MAKVENIDTETEKEYKLKQEIEKPCEYHTEYDIECLGCLLESAFEYLDMRAWRRL